MDHDAYARGSLPLLMLRMQLAYAHCIASPYSNKGAFLCSAVNINNISIQIYELLEKHFYIVPYSVKN